VEGIKVIAKEMAKWKGVSAKPIVTKPEILPLSELISPTKKYLNEVQQDAFSVPVGLDLMDLEPFQIDLADGPHFLVTGPIQSGKSITLQSWLLSLANQFNPDRIAFYLIDYQEEGLFPFRGIPHTKTYISNESDLEVSLDEIDRILFQRYQNRKGSDTDADTSTVIRRRASSEFPALILAVDDYDIFEDQTSLDLQERITDLIRQYKGVGFHILVGAPVSEVTSGYSPLLKTLKANPTGFLLGSTDSGYLNAFNIRLPIGESGQTLPPGEGIFAQRGKYTRIKIATPWEGEVDFQDWINNIIKRK
jgi:S-DNA-T family DNA segregation ATPase FtsK/SpoIIIE